MIEILTLFSFVLILGLALKAQDWMEAFRMRKRRKYLNALMGRLEGGTLREANRTLGDPTEIVAGSGGRLMYVWKGPEQGEIPEAEELVIVTVIAEADGTVTKAAWEQR
jgi:hypothetical protein